MKKKPGLAVIQNGLKVTENKSRNSLEIRFDISPDSQMIENLKANGFRHSISAGCWYAFINDSTKLFAYTLQV